MARDWAAASWALSRTAKARAAPRASRVSMVGVSVAWDQWVRCWLAQMTGARQCASIMSYNAYAPFAIAGRTLRARELEASRYVHPRDTHCGRWNHGSTRRAATPAYIGRSRRK